MIAFGWKFAPDPAGGAYSTPQGAQTRRWNTGDLVLREGRSAKTKKGKEGREGEEKG